MRRIENLISDCRRITSNEQFTSNTGIADEDFIFFLNEAQEQLQSEICSMHQNVFVTETFLDVVRTVGEYDLPDDCYGDNRIVKVWYSKDNVIDNTRRLHAGEMGERLFTEGTPLYFIRSSGKLYISPRPDRSTTEGLRLMYVKRLPKLDKRRGKVATVALDTTNRNITTLALDTNEEIDSVELLKEEYCSIVDRFGDVKMARIPLTAIDLATGAVTIDTFTYESGETIAVGDYIVRGHIAANRSEMPQDCEDYLVQHCMKRILFQDSSTDWQTAEAELLEARRAIANKFSTTDETVRGVAITDDQFIDEWELFE